MRKARTRVLDVGRVEPALPPLDPELAEPLDGAPRPEASDRNRPDCCSRARAPRLGFRPRGRSRRGMRRPSRSAPDIPSARECGRRRGSRCAGRSTRGARARLGRTNRGSRRDPAEACSWRLRRRAPRGRRRRLPSGLRPALESSCYRLRPPNHADHADWVPKKGSQYLNATTRGRLARFCHQRLDDA